MSDNDRSDLNSQAVPFFARYLEGQFCQDLSEEEMETVQGGITFQGGIAVTLKYPSDNEEGGGGVITNKFPSDQEDWGGGIITNKFPSDKEDWGGGVITRKFPSDADEYAVTQKYPSDGDDQAFPID
jgi:Serine endopeptidase inhibitors